MSNLYSSGVSESTLKRNFDFGEGRDLGEITEILSAYQNKDTSRLKELFGKPRNFKNKTILAYASNVKQYVDRLSQPTNQIKNYALQRFGVQLTDNRNQNFQLMGNQLRVVQPPPPPPPRSRIEPIIRPSGAYYKETPSYAHVEFQNPSEMNIREIQNQSQFFGNDLRVLRANGVEKMRIFAILVFSDGTKQFVSTEAIDLDNTVDKELFFQDYQFGAMISQQQSRVDSYDKFDFQSGTIQRKRIVGIESIFVKYYKRGYQPYVNKSGGY